MVSTKFIFNTGFVKHPAKSDLGDLPKDLLDLLNEKPLIDDVDTTITSFIKVYGQPPHLDIDDSDDSNFDKFDDFDDDDVPAEKPAPVVDIPKVVDDVVVSDPVATEN